MTQNEKITAIFDRQAASYDEKWSKLAPINATLHLLASAVFGELPATARVLCVGAGTGAEIVELARRFPGWRFTAVEPSAAMVEVCRRRAAEEGMLDRCAFHQGYLDALPATEPFDAATAFLVSQFLIERPVRVQFFRSIAERLRPGGTLVSSDLSGDLAAPDFRDLLEVWFRTMNGHGLSAEEVEKMREAYQRDVAVAPPAEVRAIITEGGFVTPVQFFQAGLIHAWFAQRGGG